METEFRRFTLVAVLVAAAFSTSAVGEDFKVTAPKASVKVPKTLPSCPRPQDFSVAKDVSAYELCVELQNKFCDIHDTASECKKLVESRARRVIRAGGDVDASKICAIQHDGSYLCEGETLRFIVKDEARPGGSPGPSEIQPLNEDGSQGPPPAPAGSGGVAPQGAPPGAPGGDSANPGNPAAGGNPMPFIPPPPPPGYVPPNH